ncbi:pyridoxamine 5'-phosphate oxidase [Picosynechococcus sp. PCC 7117]|uniref:pyridoxamine 5'-phosphate oxidase n=1 Tax=Picosynechococcus sp. PCC 7117 TaxID=195498 RepID=UPI0008107752|nr:pyridoxamine 5'-phosphate oxidase [Picosynechococcus sp. PCC 7117]ANV88318.1 pyridoxamine 5'-phosphate oxidase [Picosynechococcus sp. PCC 7117]
MIMHVANLRQNYTKAGLHEDDVSDDPMVQFATWFQQATEIDEIREPNAMVLSSVGPDGKPSSRVVLLKDFSEAGFTFFTNYTSQKGLELTGTQYAALVFWWEPLERQVRIEGTVEKLPPERSDEYFASRPRKSQIGAWASAQSQAIANREVLEQRFKDLEAEYADKEIPRPDHWGGFLVKPEKIEFWQGRPSRLHDRLVFTLQGDRTWQRQRLAP